MKKNIYVWGEELFNYLILNILSFIFLILSVGILHGPIIMGNINYIQNKDLGVFKAFFFGIKSNFKYSLIFGLVSDLIIGIIIFNYLSGYLLKNGYFYFVYLIIYIFIILQILFSNLYFYYYISKYKAKFWEAIKISYKIGVSNYFLSIIYFIIIAIFLFLSFKLYFLLLFLFPGAVKLNCFLCDKIFEKYKS